MRHLLKTEGFDAGFHARQSPSDPEAVQIQIFEPPGVEASDGFLREIEKHVNRQELRRAAWDGVGEIRYPARAAESYAHDLLASLDVEAIRARGFRIVIGYSFSSASLVMPLLLGQLGVEAVETQAHVRERATVTGTTTVSESVGHVKRLVMAVGADLGVALDPAGERLYLVDEQGREVPVEQELLLFLRLLASDSKRGRLALPITATSLADQIVEGSELEIERTPASLPALTAAATEDGVVFAGSAGGGFVFPDFIPAYDGVASLCKLLELLAPIRRPLSELVAELPQSTVVHRQVRCPFSRKGTVMRVLTEQLRDRDVDTLDGIKVYEDGGWAQVLPDPAEPLVHVYAEGATQEQAQALEERYTALVQEIIADDGGDGS
jgi:mannose-1-phosphate guanylyltransferase/phosphomannomutase